MSFPIVGAHAPPRHEGSLRHRVNRLLTIGLSDSLVLYSGGQQDTESALRELRTNADGTAEAEAAARVESAARTWERWAESLRLRVAAAPGAVIDPLALDQGRRLFGHFRAAQRDLVNQLEV